MAIYQSDFVKGLKDVPYPANAGQACAVRFFMQAPANLALNDILELAVIPAGCRPIAVLALDCDDLDSNGAPAINLDVGVMSGESGEGGARTCGAEFLAASQVARAGGSAAPTLASAFRVDKAGYARSIGVKVAAAAATPQAGIIGLTVIYAAC